MISSSFYPARSVLSRFRTKIIFALLLYFEEHRPFFPVKPAIQYECVPAVGERALHGGRNPFLILHSPFPLRFLHRNSNLSGFLQYISFGYILPYPREMRLLCQLYIKLKIIITRRRTFYINKPVAGSKVIAIDYLEGAALASRLHIVQILIELQPAMGSLRRRIIRQQGISA